MAVGAGLFVFDEGRNVLREMTPEEVIAASPKIVRIEHSQIIDEFTFIPGLSRQQRFHLRRRRDGKCLVCGKQCEPGYVHCRKDRVKVLAAARRRKGLKKWRPIPGKVYKKRGRPQGSRNK
jgi:hypothetical protein